MGSRVGGDGQGEWVNCTLLTMVGQVLLYRHYASISIASYRHPLLVYIGTMPPVSLGTLPYTFIGPTGLSYIQVFSWFRLIGTMPRRSWTLFLVHMQVCLFSLLKIGENKEEKWKMGRSPLSLSVNTCQSFDYAFSMIFMDWKWSPIPNKWLLSFYNYKMKKPNKL